jgi:plasmid stabilization system protein ParE
VSTSDRRILIRPEAAFEMNAAFLWHEAQRAGLGADFLRMVDAAFAAISRDPLIFREVRPGVRRALLRRFPYGVFFGSTDADVTVLAVLHHRRSPRRWPRRAAR